ncbi:MULTISPECIES: oligosaccharide flippase family protein [Arthrobacter]|uniref:Polysaccharide biosynthesis protein n=1 Tax=Arthrobacter psychrochitiniphilus TaxID=291045 RepID=A0A2V3DXT9_9MICC|nr:oligosaccharide flippase family protein [Arthrobacter psychrochitiniphilus]NYG16546.1 PST family polysaccharide transporter [Arthrobacter psychrochitiniphilus]PXA69330.1 polysaccharide biosynthesis protein [Arthrobacter psychrochitiniphilus]
MATPLQESEQAKPTAARAFALSLLNTVISRFGTIGIGIALARLLGPEQFGTYAIAFVALIAILSFNELGVSLAIVRWPGDPKEIAGTVTTISIISSTLIFAGAFLGAPYFAAAMGDPEATAVVRVIASCVIINGAVATPAALMQRDFLQGRRMIIDQVNVWLGAIVSVVLVVVGLGAMSLAIGRVAASLVAAIMFIKYSPLPVRFGFNKLKLRALLVFGLPLAGSSIVVFAVGYADQIIAGKVLGAVALGFYVLAFNLSSWPTSIFSQPLRGVAPPVFAKLQHDPPAMRSAMLSLTGVVTAAVLPVVAVMAGVAVPLVTFVYGTQWAPAAVPLVWLAAFAVFRILFELVYDYLVVLGSSGPIFKVQILWLVVLIPALFAGAHWAGLAGLAAAPVGVAALVVLPIYLRMLTARGFRLVEFLGKMWPAIVVAIPVAVGSHVLSLTIATDWLAVIAATGLGTAAMAALLFIRRKDLAAIRSWGREQELVT